MAAPTFSAAGALYAVDSGSTITPVLPAGWSAGQIAIMSVMTNKTSVTFTTPTGWTSFGLYDSGPGFSKDWFWRRLVGGDGNPTTNLDSTLTAAEGGFGRIYTFANCKLVGTPFELAVTLEDSDSTPDTTATTTTGTDELIVCLVVVDNNHTWSSGMPPAGWSNIGGIVTSSVGADAMMDAIAITKAAAGLQASAIMGTMSGTETWQTLTLALLPTNPINVALGQSSETNTATAFTKIKRRALLQSSETNTSQAFGKIKHYTLAQALEINSAQLIERSGHINQVFELDEALVILVVKHYGLTQASEINEALLFTVHIPIYTFIGPTRDSIRYQGGPLMDHLGSVPQGITIWRDANNVWHEMFDFNPYGDSELFDNKVEYYQGGREYILSPTQKADLIAAGYGAYIVES